MTAPSDGGLTRDQRRAVESLANDMRRVFGTRLHSIVAYGRLTDGSPLHTLVLVERITFDDLAACAPLTDGWQRWGLAVPLVLSRDEFVRTLDVFALEYAAVLSNHVVIAGDSPFAGVRIADADLRRACERQAKSHLIHLREGFLEAGRNAKAVSAMIAESVPAFELLLANIARLDGAPMEDGAEDDLAARAARAIGLPPALLGDLRASRMVGTIVEPTALLSRYVAAAEQTWLYVDSWRPPD